MRTIERGLTVRSAGSDRGKRRMSHQQTRDGGAIPVHASSNQAGMAAMEAGLRRLADRRTAQAQPIALFEFAALNSITGAPIASGSFFAAEQSQVASEVGTLLSEAQQVLAKLLDYGHLPSIGPVNVDVQRKTIPLLNPPPFDVTESTKMVHSVELVMGGENFFPEDLSSRVRKGPAGSDRSDREIVSSLISQIIAVDPLVRKAHAAGKSVSWILSSFYSGAEDGSVRTTLHVASDGDLMPVTISTAKTTLLMLLCCVDFVQFGGGIEWSGQAAPPLSGSVRSNPTADLLRSDPMRQTQLAGVSAYLLRLGLRDIERGLVAQAIAAAD